jgi:mannose-6-phosphate isomerase-like protein (cupin superfamily)
MPDDTPPSAHDPREINHVATALARHVPLAATAALTPPAGQLSVPAFERSDLLLKLYAPPGPTDPQTPHTRDELYVVLSGSGRFVNGDTTHAFAPGDVILVPAGVVHRFVDYTPDFRTWVVFYGPERAAAAP